MAMGLDRDDFSREKRDGYRPRNAVATGLQNAIFPAGDVMAMGPNAMVVGLKKAMFFVGEAMTIGLEMQWSWAHPIRIGLVTLVRGTNPPPHGRVRSKRTPLYVGKLQMRGKMLHRALHRPWNVAGLEKAVFSARDVMAIGLEIRYCRRRKSDVLRERRDGDRPRNVMVVSLEKVILPVEEVPALGLEKRWPWA